LKKWLNICTAWPSALAGSHSLLLTTCRDVGQPQAGRPISELANNASNPIGLEK